MIIIDMRVSNILMAYIKEIEALRLQAYKCPAGVWTIGYGHTKGVKPGMVITKAQAETLLRGDILPCEEYVRGLRLELTQGQFDALVDFCFNAGTDALRRSTLLQRVRSYLALAKSLGAGFTAKARDLQGWRGAGRGRLRDFFAKAEP